jgi:hypothetical protein
LHHSKAAGVKITRENCKENKNLLN